MQNSTVKKIVVGVGIFFILTIILGFFGTVGAGERGVKTRFNNIVGTLQPGLYFKMPWIEKVTKIDVQTQKVTQDATAASSDLQDVETTIAVNYNIDPSKVAQIYQNVGEDYQDVIIDPAIQETIKASTANYTAEQLVTEREKVRAEVVNALTSKLQTQGILVTQVSITNFAFSDEFNHAIEAKVTAEQNALAAKNLLEQKKYEAEQTVVTAKAQAEAIQIQAQAINSQGGADYVALQALKEWKGGCTSYCVGNDTSMPNMFFNINK